MTANDLYIYFKACHLCAISGCGDCKEQLYGNAEHDCPFDIVDKNKIREYLYNLADKLLIYDNKNYSIDENDLMDLLLSKLQG